MGLLFNTDQTVKMVALLNRHFGADLTGGAFEIWRDRKDDIDPSVGGNALPAAARKHDVYPDPTQDALGKTKGRWLKWLRLVENQNQTTNFPTDPGQFPGLGVGAKPPNWKPAPTAAFGVGSELRRQMWNGLNDPNCIEIGFMVIPFSQISILSMSIVATPLAAPLVNAYSMVISIQTTRVP